MPPVKMIIPGEWWDSYIYRAKLHLFGRDGDVRTVDWQQLVDTWPTGENLRLPMDAAFGDGRYLYGSHWRRVFADAEVRAVLGRKFDALSRTDLIVDDDRMEAVTIDRRRWEQAFPFSDMTVYTNTLFTASPEGLYEYPWDWGDRGHVEPPGLTGDRRWDAPLVALEAGYNSVAVAAGDAGLFELPVRQTDWNPFMGPRVSTSPAQRLGTHCSDCHWLYYSLLGSSHLIGGALAAFRRETGEESTREFETVLEAEEIFARSLRVASEFPDLVLMKRVVTCGVRKTRYIGQEAATFWRLVITQDGGARLNGSTLLD